MCAKSKCTISTGNLRGDMATVQVSLSGEIPAEPAITYPVNQEESLAKPMINATVRQAGTVYDIKYLAKVIRDDRYIFDVRCWPNGITKYEFFKRWNRAISSMDIIPDKDGYWWNAGHFAYAVDRAKKRVPQTRKRYGT